MRAPPVTLSGEFNMYSTIIVPLDGSPAAEHALPWALSIAQQEGTSLHLVRVHQLQMPIMVGTEMTADVAVDEVIRHQEMEYLTELTARLAKVSTVPVHASLLEGSVAEAIHERAQLDKADLIVLTTHGRGAFASFWLGSAADAIVRRATTPTLLVRPTGEHAADLTARPFLKRLVIPLDGSDLAERIVGPALKLGMACGADYDLVMVLEAVPNIEAIAARKVKIPGGWMPEATLAKAEAYLEHIAHKMRGHSVIVHQKVIPHGAAASTILEYAKTHGNPVIALATHGRSGLRKLLLGSTADKIIRAAAMPVLVYHPADAD